MSPRAPRRDGPASYAAFVAQGKGVALWETALQGQIYLGGYAFVQRMQALTREVWKSKPMAYLPL